MSLCSQLGHSIVDTGLTTVAPNQNQAKIPSAVAICTTSPSLALQEAQMPGAVWLLSNMQVQRLPPSTTLYTCAAFLSPRTVCKSPKASTGCHGFGTVAAKVWVY